MNMDSVPTPKTGTMLLDDEIIGVLRRREQYRDWYLVHRDPIFRDRLLWQAQAFRHMVHLLPGETILEVGAGQGHFTKALSDVSKNRNPITAAMLDPGSGPDDEREVSVERTSLAELSSEPTPREFDHIVVHDLLDRQIAGGLLSFIYDRLRPGGHVVLIESNPWNPFFAVRNWLSERLGKDRQQWLISQPELYEQFSEIGFIRISAQFTDFVYRPLNETLCWIMRNASIVLENTPFIRIMAGRIFVHAQKPPRQSRREAVRLTPHEALHGKVSVVVPCHNESMNVGPLVDGLRAHYDDYIQQFVLVDDNSTDNTRQVIEEMARTDSRITAVVRQPPNGVGRAIREGYAVAEGEYILSMDCDFQHLLPELEDMFDAVAEGFDAAVGSRFSRHSLLINYPFGKIVANRGFHLLFNILFRRSCRDLTNNLKLMRADLAQRMVLKEPWFAVNAETGLQLALMDCRLAEVPISWIDRTFDMGQSAFRVLGAGGGYARVLFRMFFETKAGFRKLP